MDLSTITGVLVGTALVLGSILLGQDPSRFLDLPSFLLVFGGTLGVTCIRNPMSAVFGTFAVVSKAFTTRLPAPGSLIEQIVGISQKARRDGLLSLQRVTVDDPFLAKGVRIGVDGIEPAQIRRLLETEIAFTAARHKRGQEILEGMGMAAPAFGMIGTLIGLVQMLSSLRDPKTIGPAMALALLTTLYGALIANLFAIPLADKLKVRTREEVLNMSLCLEGVIGVVQGEHPATIEQKLKAFLDPRSRTRAA